MPEALGRPRSPRILLILVAGIGDFVMASPTLRAIRTGFPETHLTLLTTPQVAELASPCPLLDEVVTFDLRTFRPLGTGMGWVGWRELWDVLRTLRSHEFHYAVNLYHIASLGGALRMAVLVHGVRAGCTVGRWSGGLGAFYRIRTPDHPHQVDAMLSVAEALGCPISDRLPELWIPSGPRQAACQRLQEVNLSPESPYITMNISSARPEARLPVDLTVRIAREVHRATDWPILFTGDASAIPAVTAVSSEIGHAARNLAGRTSLLELAAILGTSRLVLTTDSGPMHVAAAVGTPLVALFGPADPASFGPRGVPNRIAIIQGRSAPRDPKRWARDLPVAEVVQAVLCLLAARNPS